MSGRMMFAVFAGFFLAVGALTSTWISLAQFDDPFCFGRHYLWGALDPGALSFSDAVEFFSRSRIEHYAHPGVTMDLVAGSLIRGGYCVSRVFGGVGGYEKHVVEHRFFYFGLVSFLSTVLFLACCRPLFRICRLVVPEPVACVVCAVFLGSPFVLLFINRFSPEAYMLFFGLWCAALSLEAMASGAASSTWMLAGAAAGLSLLSKPFMAPVAVLAVAVILFFEPASGARRRFAHLGAFLLGLAVPLAALGWKIPLRPMCDYWVGQVVRNRGIGSFFEFFSLPHQAPLVPAEAAFGVMALLGIGFAFSSRASIGPRRTVGLLAGLLGGLAAMVARRPDWHYLFGCWWLLALFAVIGIDALMKFRGRADPVVLGALAMLTLNAWSYFPGIAATHNQYRIRFHERLAVARSRPLTLPAPWEKRVGDSDLSEVWPVHSVRLEAALEQMRREARGK
ncbi:MAG: glycosyltransferase family 39 protein [Thermoanaerobaculia bacterium]